MPNYKITAPDGKIYHVTGDSELSALSALKSKLGDHTGEVTPELARRELAARELNRRIENGQSTLSLEQQKAVALASARKRLQDTAAMTSAQEHLQDTQGNPDNSGGGVVEGFSDATRAAQNSAMYGFGDEIAAGMLAPIEAAKDWFQGNGFDLSKAYENNLAFERNQDAVARERSPVASIAGDIAGGLAAGGPLTKLPGLTRAAGNTFGRLAQAGYAGGVSGALYGSGNAEGDRLAGAAAGAGLGAATGIAAYPVMAGLTGATRGVAEKLAARKLGPVPTLEELKASGHDLYKRAFNAGVRVKPEAYQATMQGLAPKLRAMGVDRELTPGTFAAIRRLAQAGNGDLSLQELDILRRIAGNAAGSPVKGDRAAARTIIEALDGMVDNPANFVTNSPEALGLLKDARSVWHRSSKGETIQRLFDRAELAKAPYGEALKNEFRTFARSKNGLRGFAPAEKDMVKDYVKNDGKTLVLRALGSTGNLTGTGAAGAAGYALGGPFGAAAAGGAAKGLGFGAKAIGNRASQKGAQRVFDAIMRGNAENMARGPSGMAQLAAPSETATIEHMPKARNLRQGVVNALTSNRLLFPKPLVQFPR